MSRAHTASDGSPKVVICVVHASRAKSLVSPTRSRTKLESHQAHSLTAHNGPPLE